MARKQSGQPNRLHDLEAGGSTQFFDFLTVESPLGSFAVELPAEIVRAVFYGARIEIGKNQPLAAHPHDFAQIL
jgi:hypothetical protein